MNRLNRPEGFLYGYDLYTFTTPVLKAGFQPQLEALETVDLAKPKSSPLQSGQQPIVKPQLITDELYQSAGLANITSHTGRPSGKPRRLRKELQQRDQQSREKRAYQ